MAKKIYIDPGHGGSDPGAVKGKRTEKDDVLRLSLLLADALRAQGVEVKLSRSADKNALIAENVKAANAWNGDYYLSIHRNSAGAKASGNEIWVYSKANAGTVTNASGILSAVCAVDGLPNRGVKKGAVGYTDYGVNRDTHMPSALLELGFISNDADNAAFDKHLNAYAKALAKTLCAIVGVAYKDPAKSEVYRVRKSWSDAASQIGAYAVLDYAKAATKPGYSVFDGAGMSVYTVPARVAGDVDGDGKVTAEDSRKALRASAGLEKLTPEQVKAADVNGDGKVTAEDAREILRKSAGLK